MNRGRNNGARQKRHMGRKIDAAGAMIITGATMIRMTFFAMAVVLCLLLVSCEEDNLAYDVGRDSVEQFGDGRFQIAKSNDEYALCDESQEFLVGVENHIKSYKEIEPYVYVLGTEGAGLSQWSDETHVQNCVNLYINGKRTEVYIEDPDRLVVYTKVNYETGEIVQKITTDGFDNEDKKVFDELAD